jgi:hypothetical protein
MGTVGLCCSPPRDDLVLVASPIPLAATTRSEGVPELRITQGELYQFRDATVNVESWIKGIAPKKFVIFDGSRSYSMATLVKVSCGSVHGALVPATFNWLALMKVASSGTPTLKDTLSKVLLACAFVNGRCMVTVMNMVSRLVDESQRSSSAVHLTGSFHTPLLRWEAFRRMAKNTLLPLAELGVVHNDIRYDPEMLCFSNIIVDTNEEFRMIDFESLVMLDDENDDESPDPPMQEYAISLRQCFFKSAYEFVFWQVLWVAYAWYPGLQSDVMVTSSEFVWRFSSRRLDEFGNWIEVNSKNGLSKIYGKLGATTKEGVEETLDIFSEVFGTHQLCITQE